MNEIKIDMELIALRKETAQFYWDRHAKHFVTITRLNNTKAIGIFSEITPSGQIYVKGNSEYCTVVDPLDIKEFYGRPDKKRCGP